MKIKNKNLHKLHKYKNKKSGMINSNSGFYSRKVNKEKKLREKDFLYR